MPEPAAPRVRAREVMSDKPSRIWGGGSPRVRAREVSQNWDTLGSRRLPARAGARHDPLLIKILTSNGYGRRRGRGEQSTSIFQKVGRYPSCGSMPAGITPSCIPLKRAV